ncbi:hypothetical protein [Microbacterium amylolyticum]|uniref:Uncharacterized protein n=1 Tax=Microbacterium amylolyticum TaxID=936337 RepID=A0ABS4ZKT2_9MICO|nr:hypothetical protein [Microbacterium amylolyticum]MBP2437901.1 hypothetical protein [Microbacterium amylolyticum]
MNVADVLDIATAVGLLLLVAVGAIAGKAFLAAARIRNQNNEMENDE